MSVPAEFSTEFMEFSRRVARAVEERREETVDLLASLVGVSSVTGDESAVQESIEREFVKRGLELDRWEATREEVEPYLEHVGEQPRYSGRPNLVGTRPGAEPQGGGRSLLLGAHADTVEAGDESAWSVGPLSGAVERGALYGRGSCDMKGGLVGYLTALDALDSLGVRLAGDVKVASTVGEENGGLGSLSTVLRGHRADAAVIAEPTSLALVTAQGGSIVFRLTVRGRSAHAAARDEGVSAFEKFLPLFEDLQAFERERNEEISHPMYEGFENKAPVNVGVVRAGNWASTVPETLTAEVRVGMVPGEELATFRERVEERVSRAARRDGWLRENPPHLEWVEGQFAPAEVSPEDPICRNLSTAHELVTGRAPNVEGVTYGADMRLFNLYGETPCVMYGAGDLIHAHAPDEHIEVEDLMTAAKTFALLISNWCGVVEG